MMSLGVAFMSFLVVGTGAGGGSTFPPAGRGWVLSVVG